MLKYFALALIWLWGFTLLEWVGIMLSWPEAFWYGYWALRNIEVVACA